MDAINELLSRGVDTIYPSKEMLEQRLRNGEKLTIYQGFDPSGAYLHIGHAVGLRKLKQFQDLGHKIIFLIGDFTGMIGDPTGKKDARKPLTREAVLENAKDYKKQAEKILNFEGDNPVEIRFNSTWNKSLTFEDVIKLASHFTVQQLLERDMFQERLRNNKEINLVEFLYPLMQGYDSSAMNVDLEIGGTDQTFNMLMGRTLVSRLNHKEKFVMTVPLLTDSKGTKIGKSEGNVIGLTDLPNDFYAKIMNLGDDAIAPCFSLLTDISQEEISKMEKSIASGENPMVYKKKLAHTLVLQFNTRQAADQAQIEFETRVQHKDFEKAQLPTALLSDVAGQSFTEQLTSLHLAESKSEAKRLINQGSVQVNGKTITDHSTSIVFANGDTIVVGKKKAIRLT